MNAHTPSTGPSTELLQRPALRSFLLFLDFFLIILAYYQVKPASRSLFLEYADARDLPYLWTASAALLLALMPLYNRLLKKHSRLNIVLGTCGAVLVMLVLFRVLLLQPNLSTAIGFYLLVDIFSVVLVEQFWSLTNSVFRSEGSRWYGLIASGGLVGGLVGGFLATALVSLTPVQTTDMPLIAAVIIALMIWLTTRLAQHGLYDEAPDSPAPKIAVAEAWNALRSSRYLVLIGVMLLLSQMGEPIIEYQFMHLVEQAHASREERTAYLSGFLSVLNGVALIVNLLVTPLILRRVGAFGGLMVQPLLLGAAAAAGFAFQFNLLMGAIVKICDRGLAYSINRTSRELIYVRVDTMRIYRAKAWIDMVGYRAFKLAGIATILLLTQWLPWKLSDASLSWVVVALCAGWIYAAFLLGKRGALPGGNLGQYAFRRRGDPAPEASSPQLQLVQHCQTESPKPAPKPIGC